MFPERHKSTYSYAAKIGLLVPPTNTVNEAEWSRMMPEGVTFHTHRMPLHPNSSTEEGREELLHDLDRAVGLLRQADVDVVAYACTAGSMTSPANLLPDAITARTGAAAVTTAGAIVAALRTLGARRVSVATPYDAEKNDHEVHFLADSGLAVERILGLGIGAGGPSEFPLIAQTPLERVREIARACFVHGSDALLITCTDFPSLALVSGLEAEFGVPVVTSNTATLWACLRRAGIAAKIDGAGVLLARH
jgi:maleate isomerase/arylmalonate decarboxylase